MYLILTLLKLMNQNTLYFFHRFSPGETFFTRFQPPFHPGRSKKFWLLLLFHEQIIISWTDYFMSNENTNQLSESLEIAPHKRFRGSYSCCW